MEISEQTILDLVKGQAAITQSVADLKSSLEKTIPFLAAQDQANSTRIDRVERKIYYFGGAGTVLGYIGSHFLERFFGGK
jgi:hypothetical protein